MGTARIVKAFFPLLDRGAHGEREPGSSKTPAIPKTKIIVVCSEVSYALLSPGFSAPYMYSMSKFALEAYAQALRVELSLLPAPVDVIAINPGAMATPMLEAQKRGGENAYFEKAAESGSVYAPF